MDVPQHRPSPRRGLAWRTTVALVLTAVIPVTLVGALSILALQDALTDRATDDLALLADAQAGRLELLATSADTHARLIASRTQLRRDLLALREGDADTAERIADILDDAVDAVPDVIGVAVRDPQDRWLAGDPEVAGLVTATQGPAADDEVWSALAPTPEGNRWLVTAPLDLDGRALGSLTVEFDTTPLAQVVRGAATAGVTTCGFQILADGAAVPLEPRTREGLRPCDIEALPQVDAATADGDLVAALLATPGTTVEGRDTAGVELLAVGQAAGQTGWVAVVSVPRTAILAPVRGTITLVAVAIVVVILASAVAAAFIARRITEPILRMRATVEEIGSGALGARAAVTGPGELGELGAGINRMADTVETETATREQRYRDLEVLTHAMAHDLKGPLTAVHGMLELVVDGRVQDAQQQAALLERAHHASRRLQRIIDDLLTLLRAQGSDLETRPVDLGALVDRVISDIGVTEVAERGPLPTVRADPVLLEHVVHNLVTNAVAYHAPEVEPQVRISARHRAGGVELLIDDAGVGIPEHERGEVLELFFRGTSSGSTRGTGLGLPIAARALERHGGTLRIQDSTLGGTRMVVWLPVQEPPAPTATA